MSTTFKQTTAPIAVLFHRLNRDKATGKRLGVTDASLALKVKNNMAWQVTGRDDLPMICPIDLQGVDEEFAGAKANPKDTYSNNLATNCEVVFLLSTNRDHGIFREAAENPNGLMDWLSLIADCLARADDESVDACLDSTCKQPFMLRWDNGVMTDLAFSVSLTVIYYPKAFERGTRSDDMQVPW